MASVELTKSIEARKLNKRTMRPVSTDWVTLPFGAILEDLTEDRDDVKFYYLGEPYMCPAEAVRDASRQHE